jgi:hypothetical protein
LPEKLLNNPMEYLSRITSAWTTFWATISITLMFSLCYIYHIISYISYHILSYLTISYLILNLSVWGLDCEVLEI